MRAFNPTLALWSAACTIGLLMAAAPMAELGAHGAGGGGAGARPPSIADPSKQDNDTGNASDEDEPLPGLENADPVEDAPAAKSDDKDIWKDEDTVYVPSSEPDTDIFIDVHKWRLTKFLHAVQIDPPGEGFGGLAPSDWPDRYGPTKLVPRLDLGFRVSKPSMPREQKTEIYVDLDKWRLVNEYRAQVNETVRDTSLPPWWEIRGGLIWDDPELWEETKGPEPGSHNDTDGRAASEGQAADTANPGAGKAARNDDPDEPLPGLEDSAEDDSTDEPLPGLEDTAADEDPDEPLPGLEDTLESETSGIGDWMEEKPDGFVSVRSSYRADMTPSVTESQWQEYQGFFTAQAFFAGWLQGKGGMFHSAALTTQDQDEAIKSRFQGNDSAPAPNDDAGSRTGEKIEPGDSPALYD